ncbi:MAG: type IVB secretion system lipoprotein DotD [Gammaproteobacteria bacterium]
MQHKRIPVIFGLVLALSSCVNRQAINNTIINNPNSAANANIKLAEAAVSISQSLQELAAIDRAANPQAKIPPPTDPVRIGMNGLASVDWTGPVEPLIRKIAKATNYRVRVLGRAPAIPVIVAIYAQSIPLADILRDVSYQAQKKATIMIYPGSRVLELRYLR